MDMLHGIIAFTWTHLLILRLREEEKLLIFSSVQPSTACQGEDVCPQAAQQRSEQHIHLY